jgi:hypothetical protein
VAVGRVRVDDFTARTMVERWDGHAWIVDPSPAPGGSAELLGVAAAGPHLWASGWYQEEGGSQRTLTLRSGPKGWKVIPSPNAGELGNLLLAVSSGPSGDVWSVGFAQRPGVNKTLTEHRC